MGGAMSTVPAPSRARNLWGCLLAGLSGGVLVGIAEVLVILAQTGRGSEYWLLPYAMAAYGGGGVVIGAVVWCVTGWTRWAVGATSYSAGLALFLLGAVVARYHLVQRVFGEQFDPRSIAGIAVQLGLLACAAGLASLLGWSVGRRLRQPRGVWVLVGGHVAVFGAALAIAALTAASTLPRSRPPTAGADRADRANLVLIIADTLRSDALGAYGAATADPAPSTPAIDQFAAQSVLYTQAFSNSTWTRPSVATILTSLYPSQHRAIGKVDILAEEVLTLPELLRQRGYWTAGVVSNINLAPVFNFQQGFQEYTYLPPSFYFGASDSASRLAIYKGLRLLRERLWRDRLHVHHYYQDAEVVNQHAFAWLDERPSQPFFLMIHYMDPHDPYFEMPYNGHGIARVSNPSPDPTLGSQMRQLYAQDVTYLDEQLGKLFAKLRAVDLYDNTVVALVADHGEEFHEHGGWWHGATLYREQMQVPMLIKRAGRAAEGRVDPRLVTTIDLAPTLLAALGEEIPDVFVGRDLFAAEVEDEEPVALAEEDFEGNVLRALRVGDWKLITANHGNPRGLATIELYDLSRDPGESTNLAASEGPRVDALLRRLTRLRLEGPRRRG